MTKGMFIAVLLYSLTRQGGGGIPLFDLKGYVLLKEGMFSLVNCLEPETGYTISLLAP